MKSFKENNKKYGRGHRVQIDQDTGRSFQSFAEDGGGRAERGMVGMGLVRDPDSTFVSKRYM